MGPLYQVVPPRRGSVDARREVRRSAPAAYPLVENLTGAYEGRAESASGVFAISASSKSVPSDIPDGSGGS